MQKSMKVHGWAREPPGRATRGGAARFVFRPAAIWYGLQRDCHPEGDHMSSQASSIDPVEPMDETQRVAVLVERARAAMASLYFAFLL